MRRPPVGRAVLVLVLLSLFAPILSRAEPEEPSGPGTIVGRVRTDAGAPLPGANVVIVGTPWGTTSNEEGRFRLPYVPPGLYSVEVSYSGFDSARLEALVPAAGEVELQVVLVERPYILPEVEVLPERSTLDDDSKVGHRIEMDEITSLPVPDAIDQIALKSGVIKTGEEIHIRGARGNEVGTLFNGIPVRDPLLGGSPTVASLGLQAIDVTLGGMDAEFGGMLSGVVDYQTKEGGRELEGEIYYMTDDYGQPDNSYENLDRVYVGWGGPAPVRGLTYYVGTEATFQDVYPATRRTPSRNRWLELISVGARGHNQLRTQGKLAYAPNATTKMTAEVVRDATRRYPYYHMWSRSGHLELVSDTTSTGEVVLRPGRFWDEPFPGSVPYNAADHTPRVDTEFVQLAGTFRQTVNDRTFYSCKLSRTIHDRDERVRGQEAWEYWGDRYSDFWFDHDSGTTSDFFVTSGDYPFLASRRTITHDARADVTHVRGAHTWKAGLAATYHDMRLSQVRFPFTAGPQGEIGERDDYHHYGAESSGYVKDQLRYEDMVLNIGVRVDLFTVGNGLSRAEVSSPLKTQVSPRVGIAYPITERDVFSFHYGRFYQVPERRYFYENRDVAFDRIRGNPNLENQTTVSYQAGIQHVFTPGVFGQFAVYYRDVFGWLKTDSRRAFGAPGEVATWVNGDYASSRGFEATLARRFAGGFSAEINYGFGIATGVASDPNAAAEQDFSYFPIDEQPLDWDIRHSFNLQAQFGTVGRWMASFVWAYASGLPYTPVSRDSRETDPETVNSRRLPSASTLRAQCEKHFELWGRALKFFVQAQNLLDARNVAVLDPGNWPLRPGARDDEYQAYYTETGRAGGAYIGSEDLDEDGQGDWVGLNDPRVFEPPRSVRVGMAFTF